MSTQARIDALDTARMKAWEEGKRLLDDSNGEMTAEQRAEWDRINADIDDKAAQARVLKEAATREAEFDQLREEQFRAYGAPVEKRGYDADAELRAFLRGEGGMIDSGGRRFMEVDIRGAARERELLRQGVTGAELRALAWDTGSSASLVPTTLARSMYEYMEASMALYRMPTTKVNTASGEPMQFPRLAGHSVATQLAGQGTTYAGTDPTFARMQLDAFTAEQLVKVHSDVLSDSGVDIGSFLGRDMGRGVGRLAGQWFATGTGSGQPNGVMTAIVGSGTIATGGSLITPTVEKLIDLQYSVNDEYRSSPAAAWLMNDSTAGTLRKLRDGAGGTIGAFLWAPSLTQGVAGGAPATFLDKPVYTDPNVAAQASNAKTVAFGDFSAFYIRTVGNPQIATSSERYFDTDEVGYRVKWRVDSDLIDTTAINVIKQNV